ncbi:MAG: neutral/alkaline non-lysosomal ceramidase N-terminal domain-containing protein [Planctomycetes bacterium]|nr:neutral/alkaline non-lysosomal ceramidase N-terminal domain-containing protein [Planctomycetota bacterium]
MRSRILTALAFTIPLLSGCSSWEYEKFEPDKKFVPAKDFGLYAGAARTVITPKVTDTWIDVDGNHRYNPDVDTYEDVNGNGKFDAVWMAGYQSSKPARGVLDDLYSSAIALSDGSKTIVFVSLDLIGFFYSDYLKVVKPLEGIVKADEIVICSTHSHASSDTHGIWGPNGETGVDTDYMEFLREQIRESIVKAVQNLQPAYGEIASNVYSEFVEDYRRPMRMDERLTACVIRSLKSKETIGSIIHWANHPDMLDHPNLMISSDWVGALRRAWENGVPGVEAKGGVTVFLNGAIGGQIEPPDQGIWSLDGTKLITDNTKEKVEAMGGRIALAAERFWKNREPLFLGRPRIDFITREVDVPLENPRFIAALEAGLFPTMDYEKADNYVFKTKLGVISVGALMFVTTPGELYPELFIGGIETPPGSDFPEDDSPTWPAVLPMMRARVPLVVGLAFDTLGYIIPKSEWDDDDSPPYLYGANESPYGEMNSVGPSVAGIWYKNAVELIDELQKKYTLLPYKPSHRDESASYSGFGLYEDYTDYEPRYVTRGSTTIDYYYYHGYYFPYAHGRRIPYSYYELDLYKLYGIPWYAPQDNPGYFQNPYIDWHYNNYIAPRGGSGSQGQQSAGNTWSSGVLEPAVPGRNRNLNRR